MKHKAVLFIILASTMFSGCKQDIKPTSREDFTGLWKLVVLEQKDPLTGRWGLFKDGLQGYILYDGHGNMAVHMTTRNYQSVDFTFHDFADSVPLEELQHRANSYVYFAKYRVFEEENKVEHSRISHSNPNLWNTTVQRWYEFNGDTLILTTVENKNSPLRVKWIRNN